MIRLSNQILFFVCIVKITIGHPTRAPQIIKDEEKVTFQNKLPEDPLDSEITVVGKPLNTAKHGFGQLKNNGSIVREKEKHHCPFCQYSANTEENRDLDSESPQPYLILGNIKPVVNQPTIITQEENHEDNNSTWNPQNQIKAILKIPEGSGKEHKRCTHGDNSLGGGLQHSELDNILLNNPDILKNIDFSCCSTLRRILLNALRLEGKCLCSDNIATSPIINITALKDNAFEEGLVRQEVQPILIKQQLDTSSKILGQEEGLENNSQGNLIYDRLMFKEPNGENHLIDSLGMRNTGENIEENNDRKHGMIDSSGKQDAMGNIGSIKNKASDLIVNLGMKNTEIGNDENNSKENDDMITTVMQSTIDNIKEGENGENVMKTSGMQSKKDSISENNNRGSHGNNTSLIQNMRNNIIGSVNGEDGVLNTLGSRNEKENKSGENEVITTSVMQNTMNSIDGNSNKDKGVMNTLIIQNTRENITENHNEENGELNTSGVPDKKYDTTKFGSEMGVMTTHSNKSKVTEDSNVTSQLPFEKPGRFMGSNINVKPMMIDSGEEVGAPSINDSLIIGNKRQIEEDLKLVEESVMGNTKKFSTIETVELSTTSLGISDSSTTEPNEKLEEIEGYLGKPGTKVNYKSTENTSNQIMDLFVVNKTDDNSLEKVLDGKHKNEENLSDLDEGINEYTTENLLRHIDENEIINFNEVTNNTTKNVLHKILGLESKELKLRNISDNLLEMNMKFSNGTTQSTQELTKVMEMESYITTPKESDLDIDFEKKANYTNENFLIWLESEELKLRNISDNILEMNMKFSNGTTLSTQELTKYMEMESYMTTPKESYLEKKANYTGTDDNLLITSENEQVLLQPISEIQAIEDGKQILERKKILSKGAKNQSFIAENGSRNLTIENYTENTWTGDKLMSTLTYNLGQQLGVDDDKLLEQTTPEHSTQNGIIFTTGYSEISTIGTEISEEPSEVDDFNKIEYRKKVLSGIPNYYHSENEESGPLELQKENGNLLREFYDKKSKENQDQAEETTIGDEFSTENSTDTSIKNSENMLLLPSQNSLQNGSTVQLNRSKEAVTDIQFTKSSPDVTRDPITSFEVNSLTTTEPILQELRSSTLSSEAKSLISDSKLLRNSSSYFEVNLLTTESILQETNSPEVFLGNEIPTVNTEKSLNNYVTDFLMNNQPFSSPDYLLSTESSVLQTQSTDNLSEDGSPNLSTVKLSDINSNDYNTNSKSEEAQSIDNQTQNGEDIQRLDPDNSENYTLGSILKPTTDGLQESEDFNLATTSSNIKLDIPLKNNQPEDPRRMNGDPKRLENGRDVVMEASLEPDNYMLGSIETGSTQTQSTKNSHLEDDILNLTSSPFDIELEKRKKIDYQLKNGQDILSNTSLQPDNNPIDSTQINEGESSTLSTDLESNSNDLHTNNGAIATTPTEASLLSQFDENKTYQNPLNMTSSNDSNRKDLLLSTNMNRVSKWNGTGIDIEMEKAENILKTLIDEFKKTHFDDSYANIVDEVTDNPEKALLETSTYIAIESISGLEPSTKSRDNNENPRNLQTNNNNREDTNNFELNSSNADVDFILGKIPSTRTSEDYFLESTTMSSDNSTTTKSNSDHSSEATVSSNILTNTTISDKNITETAINNDNIKGEQHSLQVSNTSSGHANLVDYDKYLAEINELHKFSTDNLAEIDELHKFSTDNQSKIVSLERSGSGNNLPTHNNSQIIDTKVSPEESSTSMINLLFTSRPIHRVELKVMNQSTEFPSTESELGKASDSVVIHNSSQENRNSNLVSLIPEEFDTATSNAVNERDEFILQNTFPENPTEFFELNNGTSGINNNLANVGQISRNKVVGQVNDRNTSDLEEEILSTGNYLVHHVNVSRYKDSEDLSSHHQETVKPKLNPENIMLESETTTTTKNHQKDKDTGFTNLTSNLSQDSELIEFTTSKFTKGYNESTDLAQKPTAVNDLEIHSPVIVCLPNQDSDHLNKDLLKSRFFIQNDANIIEFKLVQRNVSLCGCPHNSYELKPKSRVTQSDMNLLKTLEGQHISKILRRAHKVSDITTENYEATTENLTEIYIDSDEMGVHRMTLDKAETDHEDSGNQEKGTKKVDNYRETGTIKGTNSCNCQCLGNMKPSRVFSNNHKNVQSPDLDNDQGNDKSLESQIDNSQSEKIMKLNKEEINYAEEANYKRKYNRDRPQAWRRRDFPIRVDKDILKRFMSVFRPHNFRRS